MKPVGVEVMMIQDNDKGKSNSNNHNNTTSRKDAQPIDRPYF